MSRRAGLSTNWRVRSEHSADASIYQSPRTGTGNDHQWPNGNHSRPAEIRQNDANSAVNTVRGEDDPRTLQAIAEGRRVYVGNMPYMAKLGDVKALFANGDYSIEHINISIDPFTGRNPSYCFVELRTQEMAERAILELNGTDLVGRPVKVGPGVASHRGKLSGARNELFAHRSHKHSRPTFDRWVRTDAADHWKGYTEQKRRLYVGGLPKMPDHYSVDTDVRNLFKGFAIDAVSKVVIPRNLGYNNRYLFVDFSSASEAERARKAVNGKIAWSVPVRVTHAQSSDSAKVDERRRWEEEQERSHQMKSKDAESQ